MAKKYKIHLPKKEKKKQRILIYGAGEAGNLVLSEIKKQKEATYEVVGFLDDDEKKHSKKVGGVKVLGGIEFLQKSAKSKLKIDEVLIAIPSAPSSVVKQIVDACDGLRLKYKILPGIYDIVSGRRKISPIREVRIEDILGRESVKVSFSQIALFLNKRSVLVTGAGGSIGSELVRQIFEFDPAKIILFDHNESGVYDLHMELQAQGGSSNLIPVVGDIRDYEGLAWVFEKHKPNIAFNAAAYKHVPLMEHFPHEAVSTNVRGTLNLLKISDQFPLESFVFISTDKAVYPKGVMGATKRIGEHLVINKAKSANGRYNVVRFGNVLGSRGSVVPLFLRQIERGGPVTVTHPEIERYFMTIPEAAQLVLQAAATAAGGEIFMLEMGEKVKILDLAKKVIRLAGFEPEKDIEIKFVGLRPGEKLTEVLKTDEEKRLPTEHEKISLITGPNKEDIEQYVEELLKISRVGNLSAILRKLKEIR